MPLKLLLFLSYSHALTIAALSWLVSLSPWSANFRVQNCATGLVVRAPPHVHITAILRRLHWLPVRARISFKTACLCFNAITSSTPAHLSDILHLYSPSRTLRSSANTRLLKFHSISARQKVIVLSLTLAPRWGAVDAEIKVPPVENTELKRSPFKVWSRSVHSRTCYAYC